jgi:hypothetical protein
MGVAVGSRVGVGVGGSGVGVGVGGSGVAVGTGVSVTAGGGGSVAGVSISVVGVATATVAVAVGDGKTGAMPARGVGVAVAAGRSAARNAAACSSIPAIDWDETPASSAGESMLTTSMRTTTMIIERTMAARPRDVYQLRNVTPSPWEAFAPSG